MTAAASSLSGCVRRPAEKILPYAKGPEHIVPGVPMHYATTVAQRGEPIGLLVTTHEGRPTKVEGNKLHPSSQGATDLQAQAMLMDLYDPDRSKKPRFRGERSGGLSGNGTQGDSEGSSQELSYKDFEKALNAIAKEAEANRGRGLRVLASSTSSPTWLRLRKAVLERYPQARFCTYSSVNESNAREGARLAFGRPVESRVHFENARVIVSIDCDFLHGAAGAVRASKGFAKGRVPSSTEDSMNRLYVVESTLSATGASADHRLRIPARQIGDYLGGLFAAVLRRKSSSTPIPQAYHSLARSCAKSSLSDIPPEWFDSVADDLLKAGDRGIVVVGSRQPPVIHALAFALNEMLGSKGSAYELFEPLDVDESAHLVDLELLLKELQDGIVSTLVIVGGNPVYDAPVDAKFETALRKPGLTTIHLSSHMNETSKLATWHVPASHVFESWGDHQTADGYYSVQQPMIEPLWGSWSGLQVLAVLAGRGKGSARKLVEETFRDLIGIGPLRAESAWRRTVREGVVDLKPYWRRKPDGSEGKSEEVSQKSKDKKAKEKSESSEKLKAAAPVEVSIPGASLVDTELRFPDIGNALERTFASKESALGSSNLEVVFCADNKLVDGSHANNMWLLELPDPITKISWDNAALLSPTTAKALNLANGDLVRDWEDKCWKRNYRRLGASRTRRLERILTPWLGTK